MKDNTSEFLAALLAAPSARKEKALQILRGDLPAAASPAATDGPLLLGMSAAARYLGIVVVWNLRSALPASLSISSARRCG